MRLDWREAAFVIPDVKKVDTQLALGAHGAGGPLSNNQARSEVYCNARVKLKNNCESSAGIMCSRFRSTAI